MPQGAPRPPPAVQECLLHPHIDRVTCVDCSVRLGILNRLAMKTMRGFAERKLAIRDAEARFDQHCHLLCYLVYLEKQPQHVTELYNRNHPWEVGHHFLSFNNRLFVWQDEGLRWRARLMYEWEWEKYSV